MITSQTHTITAPTNGKFCRYTVMSTPASGVEVIIEDGTTHRSTCGAVSISCWYFFIRDTTSMEVNNSNVSLIFLLGLNSIFMLWQRPAEGFFNVYISLRNKLLFEIILN